MPGDRAAAARAARNRRYRARAAKGRRIVAIEIDADIAEDLAFVGVDVADAVAVREALTAMARAELHRRVAAKISETRLARGG